MAQFLHLYGTETEFNRDYNGEAYEEPWVSLTLKDSSDADLNRVDYNQKVPQVLFSPTQDGNYVSSITITVGPTEGYKSVFFTTDMGESEFTAALTTDSVSNIYPSGNVITSVDFAGGKIDIKAGVAISSGTARVCIKYKDEPVAIVNIIKNGFQQLDTLPVGSLPCSFSVYDINDDSMYNIADFTAGADRQDSEVQSAITETIKGHGGVIFVYQQLSQHHTAKDVRATVSNLYNGTDTFNGTFWFDYSGYCDTNNVFHAGLPSMDLGNDYVYLYVNSDNNIAISATTLNGDTPEDYWYTTMGEFSTMDVNIDSLVDVEYYNTTYDFMTPVQGCNDYAYAEIPQNPSSPITYRIANNDEEEIWLRFPISDRYFIWDAQFLGDDSDKPSDFVEE